jgi:large exoprotein involved in heme utilization and adhesion
VGQNSGSIQLQSRHNPRRDQFGDPIGGGLQVQPGETLALIGNGLTVDGGYLTAPGGQIALISSTGEIELRETDRGWQFRPPHAHRSNPHPQRDIRLQREAILNATNLITGGAGGAIQLWGDQIVLTGGISVLSDSLEPFSPASELPMIAVAGNAGAGNAGAGDVRIQATNLQLANFSLLRATTFGDMDGGDVQIQSDRLAVRSGSELSTLTFGAGDAGNVTIQSRHSIVLSGRNSVLANGLFAPTGLLSQVSPQASGQGGRIRLTTGQLSVQAGAAIATDTSGSGAAGLIEIAADQVELSGVLRTRRDRVVLDQNLPFPSGIFADSNPTATASGGNIILQTQTLRLREGAVIQTNAEGSGDAGNIRIRATEQVSLSGQAGVNLPPTTIFAASGGLPGAGGTATATGRGGTVVIQTPLLQVDQGGAVAVSSLNPDQQSAGAGNLRVQADRIQLSNQSQLSAITASGDGGNVTVQTQTLTMRSQSAISTTAGTLETDGNGGNVAITTDYLFAAPAENSDITANAFLGDGGTVTLTASGLIGIEPRDRPTAFSDITASSEFGSSGQIIIRSPDVRPLATVSELPTTLLGDRPTQGCETQRASNAEFFNTGRGGLPLSPYESIGSNSVLSDLRLPSSAAAEQRSVWTEATDWNRNEHGEIVLVTMAEEMNGDRLGCRRGG